jgi:hypothetical protein
MPFLLIPNNSFSGGSWDRLNMHDALAEGRLSISMNPSLSTIKSSPHRFLAYYQVALRLGPRKNRQTSTALTSVSGVLNAKPPEVTTQIQK